MVFSWCFCFQLKVIPIIILSCTFEPLGCTYTNLYCFGIIFGT